MDKCVCHLNGYAIKDAQARQKIAELEGKATELQEIDSTLRNDVDSLLSSDTNVDARITEIETDVANNTSKLSTLETQVGTNAEGVGNNERRIETIEGQISELSTADENINTAISELTTKVNSVKSMYYGIMPSNTINVSANIMTNEGYVVGDKIGVNDRGFIANISNETIRVKVSSSFTYFNNNCNYVWLKLLQYGTDETNNMTCVDLFSLIYHNLTEEYVTSSITPMIIELKPGDFVSIALHTATGNTAITLTPFLGSDPGYLLVEEI